MLVTLPDLGEGISEAEIVSWHVCPGAHVEEDAPLVEVETDKTTMTIPAPAAGRIDELTVKEGDRVVVGSVLAVIDGDEEGSQEPGATGREAVYAPPLAATHDRAAAESDPSARGGEDGEIVPLSPAQRRLAQRLLATQRNVPAVTVVEECDFTDVGQAARPLLPRTIAAVAHSLRQHPDLNATFQGGEYVRHSRCDIAVAVQTARGLITPVIRSADCRSEEELASEIDQLRHGALEGSLSAGQLRESTFTITSAGRLGGLFATPLINAPEVAILGLHRVSPRPVVMDGRIAVREIGLVSCTFDHRVIDGTEATAFLLDTIDCVGRRQ